MKALGWILVSLVSLGAGRAQQTMSQAAKPVGAVVSFEFERVGLPVPHFVVMVHEDGSGSYEADEVERRSADSAVQLVSRKHVERAMTVSPGMTEKIFRTARMLNRFDMVCESKVKNIADTGKKTFTYRGEGGSGTCTYNYSDDKNVAMLADTFFGIANTMDIGRKLDFEHRFDRLGLDAELIALEHSVKERNALELGTISATLRSIAGDVDLMQRVRVRATKLMEQAAADKE